MTNTAAQPRELGETTIDEIPHHFPRGREKKQERDEPRGDQPVENLGIELT